MSVYDWDLHRDVHHHHHHQQQQQQQQQQQRFSTVEPTQPEGGKRSRQTYSKYQTAVLETVFHTSKYIVRSKRQQMSAELDLTERQIKIWFQNRRMKEKKCRKEVQRIDATNVPAAADDGVYAPAANYAPAGGGDDEDDDPMLLLLRDDTFPGYRGAGSKPALSSRRDNDASNYDLHLRPGPVVDSYDNACKVQQWPAHPVTAVDFHQDFYGDHHEPDRFQRFQTPAMHHHLRDPFNSQASGGYCNSMPLQQLQAAHGY